MPVKLFLQLRLLNPTLPVTCLPPMNRGPSFSSSANFSRIFPFKLKYRCFLPNDQLGIRRFSGRPFRSRSEFSRGGGGGERGEVRAAKSLIEDEADLSDWVSELRSDSFRGGGESDGERGGRARATVRDRGRDLNSTKRRRRESNDSEEFDNSSWRAPVGSFSRNSRINKRFDAGNDDRLGGGGGGDFSSRRKSSRFQEGKLGVRSSIGRRGGRDMESGYDRNRGGKDSRRRLGFVDEEEDEEEEEDSKENKFGIVDLLSEEESDIDEEEDENALQKKNAKSSSFGLDKQINEKGPAKSSVGKSESYLSDSRY